MILNHFIKNKEKRKRIAHIGAAVTILIHAYENYETGHHSYEIFLTAGIVVLIMALIHPIIEKKFPWVDGIFLVIEGILSLIIAYDLYNLAKRLCQRRIYCLPFFSFIWLLKEGKKE